MGKRDDMSKYYSKLFDAIELVHMENIILGQVIMQLARNEKNGSEIDEACAVFKDSWDSAFRDIRKW